MIELNKIYNENCLTTMSKLDDKEVDFILTDPPYGIGLEYDIYNDTEENWVNLMTEVLPEMIRVSKMTILPCCKIAQLPWIYTNFPPDWLICWYKGSPGHRAYIGFNDWEPHLVYGKRTKQLCMHDFFQTKSSPKKGSFNHPCPKPIEWANWIISRVARRERITVYDPFCGSGTVPVSCIINNCDYIASEISEKYCQVIEQRIAEQINA